MDFHGTIITYLFHSIDEVAERVVVQGYHNLAMHLAPLMWLLLSIYIGFMFLKAMQGYLFWQDFLSRAFKIIIVMTLALNYNYFCIFIYDVFTKEPLYLCQYLSQSSSLEHQLDNLLSMGVGYANKYSMFSSFSLAPIFYGLLLFILTIVMVALGAGLIIVAKCGSIILLALSPLFLFFSLFDLTRGMFESYLRILITYAWIPILVCCVFGILSGISDQLFAYMQQDTSSFKFSLPFDMLCLIQIYLLFHVNSKASALGGGFKLSGLIATAANTSSNVVSTAKNVMATLKNSPAYGSDHGTRQAPLISTAARIAQRASQTTNKT